MRRAVAEAPSNIAIVKYWGKRDELLNLPLNDSLSITLDLMVKTEVVFSHDIYRDEVYINGRRLDEGEVSSYAGRVLNFIRKKVGQESLRASIKSWTEFPASAGLASSAAGMAALVWASNDALGLSMDRREMSKLARIGSGSGCRSIYGGFVLWRRGQRGDGEDSYCEQLFPPSHWDLVDVIGMISEAKKKVPSREGMKRVKSAPTLRARLEFVENTLPQLIGSIEKKIEGLFYELIMKHSNSMHAVIMDSWPPLHYLNDISFSVMETIYEYGKAGYTFDAGPNPHIITREGNVGEVEELLKGLGIEKVRLSRVGEGPRTIEVD